MVAQENSKVSSGNNSKKSTETDTMQDVSQKVVEVSISDSGAKKDAIREEPSSVLVDNSFDPKVSGGCVQVVNKEYPLQDSKLKQIYYVTEPAEIINSSLFLSKELPIASSWQDYHGDLNRLVSMLSIKCKGYANDFEDQTISTKRLKIRFKVR